MPGAAAFFGRGGIFAKPGASVFLVPWAGTKANTNWTTRTQNSAALGGGTHDGSGAQNDEISWDIWLDDGTYKYAQEYEKGTVDGIHSIQLNAVEKGTIDAYNGGGNTLNNYSEITGIVVTRALYTFKDKIATKNASASQYYGRIQSCAWIRTGA